MSDVDLCLILHFDGELDVDRSHPIYNGGEQKRVFVCINTTYNSLMEKVVTETNWEMKHGYPYMQYIYHTGRNFTLVGLRGDDDLMRIFRLFRYGVEPIFLYIHRSDFVATDHQPPSLRSTISQLEQNDEKVTRSIGSRKRSCLNEVDINTSSVLEYEQDEVTRSNKLRKSSFMNEADMNPSRVLEHEQDDDKVTRSNGVRKRLFMNETDINPSSVLEDELILFPTTKSNRFDVSGTEPIQFDFNNPLPCATSPLRETHHFIMVENGACENGACVAEVNGEKSNTKQDNNIVDTLIPDLEHTDGEQVDNFQHDVWKGRQFLNRDSFRETLAKFAMHKNFARRQPGRPKKNRIRTEDRQRNPVKCSRCRGKGHNRQACRNPPAQE